MKGEAVFICQFAVACKFAATLRARPIFAGEQKFFCVAFFAEGFFNENPFEIAYGRGVCSFYVIAPESALSETDGLSVDGYYKAGAVVVRKDRRKPVLEFA